MRRRYLLLAAVLVVGTGLDQSTKYWADNALGTVDHPLPVHVTETDAGQTLGQLLQSRFGLSDAELQAVQERGPAGVAKLYTNSRPEPADRAFRVVAGQPRLTYYWTFHHLSLDRPPRRVPLAQNQLTDLQEYGQASVAEYVPAALPYLSAQEAALVVADYTYPVVYTPLGLDRVVAQGEIYLLMHRPVHIIDGFFQMRYAENPGAAWGLLSDQSESFRKWFFLIVSLLAVGVISTMYYRLAESQRLPAWGFAIILSGAVGNFIDRVRFNFVVDFMDMYVGDSHWPTYNVADVAISIGVGLLLLEVLINRDRAFLAAGSNPAPPEAKTNHDAEAA